MSYSKEQIELLRCTSMEAILATEGYTVDHTRQSESGSCLYRSPFRDENEPSLEINDQKHVWHDWGRGNSRVAGFRSSGDTITLVQELKGCSFKDALDYLRRFNPNISYTFNIINANRSSSNISKTKREILSCSRGLSSESLIRYMTDKRHISEDIVNHYCDEVTYCIHCIKDDGKRLSYTHSAVGFPHIDGSYTLRFPPTKTQSGKSSTGSNITFIAPDGTMPKMNKGDIRYESLARSKTVVVFEGFINYLSFLELNSRLTPTVDAIVLNSVSNVDKAMPLILNHENVVTYLDNDIESQTGQRTTQKIADACQEQGVNMYDNASVYAEYNDLNDFLVARDDERRRQAEELQKQQSQTQNISQKTEITQETEEELDRRRGFGLH